MISKDGLVKHLEQQEVGLLVVFHGVYPPPEHSVDIHIIQGKLNLLQGPKDTPKIAPLLDIVIQAPS